MCVVGVGVGVGMGVAGEGDVMPMHAMIMHGEACHARTGS